MRFTHSGFLGLLVCSALAIAQESAPESRRERWKFRKVEAAPDLAGRPVLAQAADQGDTITVLADGFAHFTVEKTYVSDEVGTPDKTYRENWVTQLPAVVRDRIKSSVLTATSGGRKLSSVELLDLALFPRRERPKRFGFMVRWDSWAGRHQEDDGSWSPSDFEFHCDEDNPPLCGGRGRERFRVAATALLGLSYVGAGYDPLREGPYQDVVRSATGWVLAQQRPDGGFAESRGAVTAMTNACATILVCRVLKALREPASFATDGPASRSWSREQVASAAAAALRRISEDQYRDGSWGDDPDKARSLSITVWNLLALKAGQTAGLESAREVSRRGRGWIEGKVASIERRPGADTGALTRARAIRAVAQRMSGGDAALITSDVERIVVEIEDGGPAARDAETLLFGTLAALGEADPLRGQWMKAVKPFIIDDQVKDGCAAGTWAVPTIWFDDGGRIVSTALMTWVLELYYRYPLALWVVE